MEENTSTDTMRRKIINSKVTAEERDLIRAKAKACGETVSNFLRRLALDHKLHAPRPIADEDLVRQLARLGNNLNQLTRLAHLGKLPDPQALERLLEDVRRLLIQTSDQLASLYQ